MSHVTVAIRTPHRAHNNAKRLWQKRILSLDLLQTTPMWLAFLRQRPRIQETWPGVPA